MYFLSKTIHHLINGQHKPSEVSTLTARLDVDFALRAARLGVWELDPATRQLNWDERCRELFGLTDDGPLTYEQALQHVHPDDKDRVNETINWAMNPQSGGNWDATYRTLGAGHGQLRWVRFMGQGYFDETGAIYRFAGIAQDACQVDWRPEEEAQRILVESEERFRTIVEQAPVAMALFSGPQFVITLANERVLEFWGRRREQVINKPLFDALPEAGQQGYEELLTGVYTTGERFVAKELSVYLMRNGQLERTYIDFVYEPFYGIDHAITGVMVACIEITEQVLARQKLHHEQNRLMTILDKMPVGVLIASPEGKLTYGNQMIEQIFRHPFQDSRDAETYRNWRLFDPVTDAPFPSESTPIMQTLLHGETVVGVAIKLRRADATWGYVSVNSVPVYDDEGELLYSVGVFVDVTEQKQAEEALQDADRRKDEFLAMLSHELRNPLAPIRNTLQILTLTAGADETTAPALALMTRQVDHLVRLVDDLLDVSRISRGKLQLRPERIELNEVIRQAIDAGRSLFETGQRELTVALPINSVYLSGDVTRLTQIVNNLLNNAAKFTHENGHVWLSVERAGNEALLRVRDDGVGIAAHQLEVIFELFSQADHTLERSRSGLGLGLTLVRQLVELHGGRVTAHSSGLGLGSEFTVYLPVLAEPPTPKPTPDQAADKTKVSHRILVIDDNPDAAMTLAMLLKLKGHQVHTRHSGQEGIAAAEGLQPELVLLDIGMPGLNGYDTCRLIRQQTWGQPIVLVALTGYGQDEDKRLSQEAGFDAHLVKPVQLAVLDQVITSLLTSRSKA